MTTRRARRRLASEVAPRQPISVRLKQWATSFPGIVSLSVAVVVLVMLQGMLRIPLPFGLGQTPPTPDPWGTITLAKGTNGKIVYLGNTANGVPLDAAGGQQAVQYALDERGEITGFRFEVQATGDNCDQAAAEAKAKEIAADPAVVGVISAACHTSNLAFVTGLGESHIPFFSLDDTSPSLTTASTGSVFRITGNQVAQATRGVQHARVTLSATKALILYEDTPDMTPIASSFRNQFRQGGGTVIDNRPLPSNGPWDEVVRQTRDLGADLVFVAASGKPSAGLLAALRAGGYAGNYLVTEAAYKDPDYTSAGSVIEGTYATTISVPRAEKYTTWKEEFEKQYLAAGPLSAEAYDAAGMLLQALTFGSKKGQNDSLEIGKQALASIIRGVPFAGVTGPSAPDGAGDRSNVQILLMRYEDGAFKQVAAL